MLRSPRLPRKPLAPLLQVRCHSTSKITLPRQSVDSARTVCFDQLRDKDYPSHLLAAFVPPQAQDAHLAIRCFNVATASIADTVSRVDLGQARMVFWQDLITQTFQKPEKPAPAEPVAILLEKVLRQDGIRMQEGWFKRIIKARKQYLGGVPFATLDDLEAYAENTYGSLHYLALESLGIQSTPLDHIGSHIGKATGIVSILRGIPYNVRHPSTPSVVLPLDVMAAHDVSQESVLRLGPEAPGLKDAVFEVATRANDHMLTARKMLNEVGEEGKGPAFSTFLPAVPTSMWLETLEKCDFNVFDSKMMGKQWTLPWRAWRAARARSF